MITIKVPSESRIGKDARIEISEHINLRGEKMYKVKFFDYKKVNPVLCYCRTLEEAMVDIAKYIMFVTGLQADNAPDYKWKYAWSLNTYQEVTE